MIQQLRAAGAAAGGTKAGQKPFFTGTWPPGGGSKRGGGRGAGKHTGAPPSPESADGLGAGGDDHALRSNYTGSGDRGRSPSIAERIRSGIGIGRRIAAGTGEHVEWCGSRHAGTLTCGCGRVLKKWSDRDDVGLCSGTFCVAPFRREKNVRRRAGVLL